MASSNPEFSPLPFEPLFLPQVISGLLHIVCADVPGQKVAPGSLVFNGREPRSPGQLGRADSVQPAGAALDHAQSLLQLHYGNRNSESHLQV